MVTDLPVDKAGSPKARPAKVVNTNVNELVSGTASDTSEKTNQ